MWHETTQVRPAKEGLSWHLGITKTSHVIPTDVQFASINHWLGCLTSVMKSWDDQDDRLLGWTYKSLHQPPRPLFQVGPFGLRRFGQRGPRAAGRRAAAPRRRRLRGPGAVGTATHRGAQGLQHVAWFGTGFVGFWPMLFEVFVGWCLLMFLMVEDLLPKNDVGDILDSW